MGDGVLNMVMGGLWLERGEFFRVLIDVGG